MNARSRAVLLSLIAAAAFVFAFLDSQRFRLRADLSAARAYSFSPSTKALVASLAEPLTITYYLSKRLERVSPAPRDVVDFLRELESVSKGKLRVRIQDPAESGTSAAVERLGVLPQSVKTSGQDETSVATVYTGIVLDYLGRTASIPMIFSSERLEYDLVSRLRVLLGGQPRRVGALVASSHLSWDADYTDLAQTLADAGWEAVPVDPKAALPLDLAALLVIGGAAELDGAAVARISAYVRSGGSALFAVDGVYVDSAEGLKASAAPDGALLRYLESCGARVEPVLALDEASLTIPYQNRAPGGGMEVKTVKYPHWISLQAEGLTAGHPLSAAFRGVDLFWASPVDLLPVPGIKETPLASTSPSAWRMAEPFQTNPELSDAFRDQAKSGRGRLNMAVALEGQFPLYSAPAGPIPKRAAVQAPAPQPAAPVQAPAPKAARVLVVGDADFAGSLAQYAGNTANLDFAVAASDWLSGNDDLAFLNKRAAQSPRLDRIADPAERAAAVVRAQFVNVLLVPLLVLAYALFRAYKKRKKRGAPKR